MEMAATFRTPGRRTPADGMNAPSPSMIPRAYPGGAPGTPTGTSEIGSAISGTTDSRKRQSKKDEVTYFPSIALTKGNSSKTGK